MKDGESGSNEGHENSSCAAENFFPIAVIISVGVDAGGGGGGGGGGIAGGGGADRLVTGPGFLTGLLRLLTEEYFPCNNKYDLGKMLETISYIFITYNYRYRKATDDQSLFHPIRLNSPWLHLERESEMKIIFG